MSDNKKNIELCFAQSAASILNVKWDFQESEEPDFLVSSPDGNFGLEVTECSSGKIKKGGSVERKDAAFRKKKMSEIQARLLEKNPEIENWNLQYIHKWNNDIESHIICAIEKALKDKSPEVGYQIFPENKGSLDLRYIMIQKDKSHGRGCWVFAADNSPAVVIADHPLERAIDDKKDKLPAYRNKSKDIRLLVVANPFSSGTNVSLGLEKIPDLRGFNKVYFMHFPNYVVEYYTEQNGSVSQKEYTLSGRTAKGTIEESAKMRGMSVLCCMDTAQSLREAVNFLLTGTIDGLVDPKSEVGRLFDIDMTTNQPDDEDHARDPAQRHSIFGNLLSIRLQQWLQPEQAEALSASIFNVMHNMANQAREGSGRDALLMIAAEAARAITDAEDQISAPS